LKLKPFQERTGKNKLEAVIQKEILDWLSIWGYTNWRSYTGPIVRGGHKGSKTFFTKNPMAGYPDITGFFKGDNKHRMFVIEVKTHKGRMSPEQKDWFALLHQHGVVCVLARKVEDVIERFRKVENGFTTDDNHERDNVPEDVPDA
jgi:hypothetical protein